MIDVEFLLSPPARLQRSIVYVYRSGVLRRSMRSALDEAAKLDGNTILNCSPSELLSLSSGSNLLGGIGVCDWSEAGSDLTDGETADALETICLSDGDPVAIFISEAKAPLKKPLWSGVPAACLVIEEPVVTRGTSGGWTCTTSRAWRTWWSVALTGSMGSPTAA